MNADIAWGLMALLLISAVIFVMWALWRISSK
jgi:hypothetical protein